MPAPSLNQLSPAQKDELILSLWPLQQQVVDLTAQVTQMQTQIAELLGRLALTSRNSSKPSSSDGLNQPDPKSLRKPTGRNSGGQKGRPASTLSQAVQPDHTVVHPTAAQCNCGKTHRGQFPQQASASVQYGPAVQAA